MLTTQKEARDAFWAFWVECGGTKPCNYRYGDQNKLPADTRVAFVDWVDNTHRSGLMSDRLARTITL